MAGSLAELIHRPCFVESSVFFWAALSSISDVGAAGYGGREHLSFVGREAERCGARKGWKPGL